MAVRTGLYRSFDLNYYYYELSLVFIKWYQDSYHIPGLYLKTLNRLEIDLKGLYSIQIKEENY